MIADLFVYGTLLREAGSHIHRLLAQHSSGLGRAVYQGRLYLVDWYPCAVPSDEPGDQVHGELYRLKEPEAFFPILDVYEGCDETSPQPSEYVRQLVSVTAGEEDSQEAWIYLYNQSINGLQRLESGDFLATLERSSGGEVRGLEF